MNFTPNKGVIITEGYGKVYDFSYWNHHVDPRPHVLSLGRWVNHKGTKLLCGVNMNYLSDDQVLALQGNLRTILGDRNLRRRVRTLRALMPDVFDSAYRTYNQDYVAVVKPGTLKMISAKIEPEVEPEPKPEPEVPETETGPLAARIRARREAEQAQKDAIQSQAEEEAEEAEAMEVPAEAPAAPEEALAELEGPEPGSTEPEPAVEVEEVEEDEEEEFEEGLEQDFGLRIV